jgi:hypothetical protein
MAIASPIDGHNVQPRWRQMPDQHNGSIDAEDGKRMRGYLTDRPQHLRMHVAPGNMGGP